MVDEDLALLHYHTSILCQISSVCPSSSTIYQLSVPGVSPVWITGMASVPTGFLLGLGSEEQIGGLRVENEGD